MSNAKFGIEYCIIYANFIIRSQQGIFLWSKEVLTVKITFLTLPVEKNIISNMRIID